MASQSPAPSATEARSLAIRLADGFARVLKHKLAAVVLHGSLTLGGYVAGRSDLDLLAVYWGQSVTEIHVLGMLVAGRPEVRC